MFFSVLFYLRRSIHLFAEASSGSGDDSVESDADVYEGEDKEAVGHDSSSRHYTSGNILI